MATWLEKIDAVKIQKILFPSMFQDRVPSSSDQKDGDDEVALTPEEKVLGNDLLLDIILQKAIVKPKGFDVATANACRLVQRLWLERVNVVLRLSRRVIKLNDLDEPTKVPGRRVDVDRFLGVFSDAPTSHIPPFKLWLDPGILNHDDGIQFDLDFLQSCVNCLANCGTGLVELEIFLGSDEWDPETEPDNLPPIPSFTLPYLDTTFIFVSFDDCKKAFVRWAARLFQAILDGSQAHSEITIRLESLTNPAHLSLFFDNVKLPSSVETLKFENDLRACHIKQLLLSSPLLHLSSLVLDIAWADDDDAKDDLSSILNHLRNKQVKVQDLQDDSYVPPSRQLAPVVLENVVPLPCASRALLCPQEAYSTINVCFSDGKRLFFRYQTFEMLPEWCASIDCTGVEVLDVVLGAQTPDGKHDCFAILQQLYSLKWRFPNVKVLKVCIPLAPGMSLSKIVWGDMAQLTMVSVRMINCDTRRHHQCNMSLQAGIAEENAVPLDFGLTDKDRLNGSYPREKISLSHLKDLERLELTVYGDPNKWESDVTFNYAIYDQPLTTAQH